MGVHTGDSITVAPAMTLTDREYPAPPRRGARGHDARSASRPAARTCSSRSTPKTAASLVIEMNPRVSRSSALASKATGYPDRQDRGEARRRLHARRAAERHHQDERRVRAGHRLRRREVAALRVREVPRRRDAARHADEERRRGDEHRPHVLRGAPEGGALARDRAATGSSRLVRHASTTRAREPKRDARPRRWMRRRSSRPRRPNLPPPRPRSSRAALAKLVGDRHAPIASSTWPTRCAPASMTDEELYELTAIDPWFLAQIARIVRAEERDRARRLDAATLREAKRLGFTDAQIAQLAGKTRGRRPRSCARSAASRPSTRASTRAPRSSWRTRRTSTRPTRSESESAARPSEARSIILGGGPNRIGQGIEFDYCCVHAVLALRELGFETIMVNCNPETVSTDYDTSDRLYFEPLTLEDVLAICDEERRRGPRGRHRAVRRADAAQARRAARASAGVKLLGTTADAIDRAEDRGRFDELLTKLGAQAAARAASRGASPTRSAIAEEIGYPVLGAPELRARRARDDDLRTRDAELEAYVALAVEAAREAGTQTILVDEFLQGRDRGRRRLRLPTASAPSSAASCSTSRKPAFTPATRRACLPPHSLPAAIVASIEEQTRTLALELGVVGLMNVQFAVKDGRGLRARGEPARVAARCRSSRRRRGARSRRSRRR